MPKDKLGVLSLMQDGSTFEWRVDSGIWAAVELTEKTNLFSKVGVGVRTAKVITVPRKDLTLHNALRWNGKHLFLTAITEVNPARMELTAALVEPVECTATRPEKKTGNGSIQYPQIPLCTFPGILTEKYLGFVQQEPQGVVEHRMVLITPKLVELKTNDLVTTSQGVFAVKVCYLLDEYKNEYEIKNTKEA